MKMKKRTAPRKILSLEENARNRDAMERIVKWTFMAKHYRSKDLKAVIGGLISSCVTYNGTSYNIVTSISAKDVAEFTSDKLVDHCYPWN